MCHMKPLSERAAESRKPLTKFYGITASESELLPLKTDKSIRTPRTTSSGGLSLPCSSSALMNSHTPKLNNRRHIERHTKTGNHKKVSCFLRLFLAFLKNRRIAPRKGKHDTLFVWQFSIFGGVGNERKMKKFFKIPAYSDLCGFVRNRGKFLQITVIFALRGVVGSRGRNAAVALAKSPLAALKVLTEAHTEETATFLEQDSTTVPNFANRSFCPAGILLGLPPQARLFAACAA